MTRITTLNDLGFIGHNTRVNGLTLDSRTVGNGDLFAALRGTDVHGAHFIADALRRGAGAILTDDAGAKIAKEALKTTNAHLIITQNPRETLAHTAALWYHATPKTIATITGTNGKTSVAHFTRQIWAFLGHKAISFGTTGVEGAFEAPLTHTTPDAITLHRLLAQATAAGVTHAAIEASSHGLDQHRLDGLQIKVAGFTNLTQDHFDYHDGFDAYFNAKARLFRNLLPQSGTAVINTDDPWGQKLSYEMRDHAISVIGIGKNPTADFKICGQQFDAAGQKVLFEWKNKPYHVHLNLAGGFQVFNVAIAAGLAIAAGAHADDVFNALPHLKGVSGRMELAAIRANGACVYVDYAHTPDAVAASLRSIRPHVMGRVLCVLGAGGNRDTSKRALMGKAASDHADVVFITDDNPRDETPADIRRAILQGARGGIEIADRAEAILRAADALLAGDVLVIVGKGHENYQEIKGVKHPFNDVEQASIAVAALDGMMP